MQRLERRPRRNTPPRRNTALDRFQQIRKLIIEHREARQLAIRFGARSLWDLERDTWTALIRALL